MIAPVGWRTTGLSREDSSNCTRRVEEYGLSKRTPQLHWKGGGAWAQYKNPPVALEGWRTTGISREDLSNCTGRVEDHRDQQGGPFHSLGRKSIVLHGPIVGCQWIRGW